GSGTEQKQVKYELEINRLKGTISSIQQERQIIEAEVQKLKEHIRRANLEVTTIRGVSSNALELEKENTRLRGERRTEQRKLEVLQQENVALQDRKERNWFLMGALVVLFSLLSGFFLSRLRGGGKRNHSRI
ncbi:MAG: TIGR04211 family SH3 domain-containing protein, partial [Gammaproteobacteria bacterium]|nr:TIGR04211 family SH3 domain-containing protein [Gammaproteobacteria bacterium]